MEVHGLIQGTPEWSAYRASHWNASDAPAMLGCSPYKSRSELLHEYATGITKEIDPITQKRFDDGHRYEALARPIAEQIIGRKLYPVVGSEGKYSASFDGLTADDGEGSEHKSLNDELRAVMVDGCTGADLPKMYRVQMEQQCMVSGASRILFMASKWNGDQLEEERHCWYEPDLPLRAEIVAGWAQFEADLESYAPPTVTIEAIGRTPESLPALRIEVTGMVTASNLAQYKEHALAVFGNINRDLKTDQDFADADKIVKWCGDVEDRLAAAKQHALSQTESIDALFRTIDEISAEARRTRLELDKLVKARKEAIREEIRQSGVTALAAHIAALNTRLGKPYMPAIAADFAGVMKGKKTVASLRDAVDTELARAKIAANEVADRIQANLNWYGASASGYEFLFADLQQLAQKDGDYFQLAAKNRIQDHKDAEEKRLTAQREQIAAEERAKAEAKVKADQEAEAERIRLQAAADQALADARSPSADVIDLFEQAQPEPVVPSTPPALKLGQIGERLGFVVTADFLTSIGFPPAATDKNAKLYHETDFPRICAAIIVHIHAVQQRLAA